METLKTLKIGDTVRFKHKFHREETVSIIKGIIIEIASNFVDCKVTTEFGIFSVGEWMFVS